jgi:uncharacterized damage-inducible protein DinB
MDISQHTIAILYAGWKNYQDLVCRELRKLETSQLELRAAPGLRTLGEIARHMIGARARWFYGLEEGGEVFKALGSWDRQGAPERTPAELAQALETTWQGMHEAIARWTPEQWQQTFPGEDESEPETFTRAWVIWHLIEHDLHHGGEISLTLGANGLQGLGL